MASNSRFINKTSIKNINQFFGTTVGVSAAISYSMTFVHVLQAWKMPLIAVLFTCVASLAVFSKIYSHTWETITTGKSKAKWYVKLPFVLLSIFMGIALYPEFFYVLSSLLGPLSILAMPIALLGTIGACSLMLKNSDDFSSMSLKEFIRMFLFYSTAVLSIGGALGFMPFALPAKIYLAVGFFNLFLLLYNSRSRIGQWNEEYNLAAKQDVSIIYLVGRYVSRVLDYVLNLYMLMIHITAEGCLPAAGVVKSKGSLLHKYFPFLPKKTLAAGTIALISSAEFVQDFYQVVSSEGERVKVSSLLRAEKFISSLLVMSAALGLIFSWPVGLVVFSVGRVVISLCFKKIANNDKRRLAKLWSWLKNLDGIKLAAFFVSTLMGLVCAHEIAGVFPISTMLMCVFAISGAFIESQVFINAIEEQSLNNAERGRGKSSQSEEFNKKPLVSQQASGDHEHENAPVNGVFSALYGA